MNREQPNDKIANAGATSSNPTGTSGYNAHRARHEQIAAIRAKCIEAHGDKSQRMTERQKDLFNEPTRLSDVLLAIIKDEAKENFTWNLRKDDLTEQSDETISWLYNLLV